MEDLASAFQNDFFDAVKVLEDFSSSDFALKDAMAEIRRRIAAKTYVCAPNFWDDLRATLKAIEERRDERAAKSKAQQVLKQIARLEVKFWAKASVAMLKELDAESRLERIVDWLQTFGPGDEEDSSSGPAVLFQVLSDVTLQKDFEAPQREALSAAVRENLQKFPVEMQAVLERVGTVTEPRSFGVPDWRRRHQPTQLDAPTLGPGAKLLFGLEPSDELGEFQVPKSATTDPADGQVAEETPVITIEDEAANAEIVQQLLQKESAKEEAVQDSAEDQPASLPYSVDPFADLLATIMSWLQQAGGTLQREAVLPLIKAMGFRVRAVIQALSQDVFWSHPEAECEILLRTPAGASLHPKPLPSNYLHDTVRRNLVSHVKQMGSKAKYDKLAGFLGWNAKSELRRTYGALQIVLSGLHEIFYDSTKLYLKQVLEGVVDWPVNKDGRIGPNSNKDTVQHWTRACDDLKGAGDIDWFNAKRQLLGVVMSQGGRLDAQVARWILNPAGEQATLERVFEVGSKYDLTKVLFWEPRRIFRRRQSMAVAEDVQVDPELQQAILKAILARGSASLEELKAALDEAGFAEKADEGAIHAAAQVIPELFFMPDHVFLRHVVNGIVLEDAPTEEPRDGELDEEEELMREGLAEVAAAAAALPDAEEDPLQIKAPNGNAAAAAQQAKAAGVDVFLNFSGFVAKKAVELPEQSGPPAKKLKLVPPWLTEGAAVRVRGEELPGAILEVKGDTCRVQLERAGDKGTTLVEEELPLSALVPVAPEIGLCVKVVSGDRIGCTGKLVGLAGAEAVVQIGGMCYETLPMGQIAVVAS
ncbi:unnamed protein product [Durusdinium trenchii]|uniref:Uncharacterized protein n=2 Tax=Durusdinium trenchii TaxID=1381693 RepID=A0ABP0KQI2_9DINO